MRHSSTFNLKHFLFIFVLTVFLIFFILANFFIFKKSATLKKALEILEGKTAQISSEQEMFAGKMKQATSSFYFEKKAREDLNYKKPGEKVVAFPIIDNSTSSLEIELEGKDFWHWILTKIK